MSGTADVRLAVVGCGTMGTAHAWAAANDPRCTVTCFVDASREKAEALAAQYGGAAETDYRRALDDPGLTGVVIALPHRLHHPVTLDVFAAGKHAMVEKPISLTVSEADDMIDAARRAARVLFVAHVLRFRRALQCVKAIVDEGGLGRPFFARYHNEHFPDLHERRWLATWEEGGVFVSGAVHHADVMRWWLGEVEAVTGHAIRVRPEYQASGREDHTMIVYRFANGAMGESTYSYATHRHDLTGNVQAYLAGEDGELVLDYNGTIRLYQATRATWRDERAPILMRLSEPPSRFESGSAAEVPHFVDCIWEGKEPTITARDARRALEIVLAARQSAHEGRTITLPARAGLGG